MGAEIEVSGGESIVHGYGEKIKSPTWFRVRFAGLEEIYNFTFEELV